MKDQRGIAALIGFAFVAAWIGFGFGEAVLCLLGAAVLWAVVGVIEGELDLGEVQDRLTRRDQDPPQTDPPARPRGRSRVQ